MSIIHFLTVFVLGCLLAACATGPKPEDIPVVQAGDESVQEPLEVPPVSETGKAPASVEQPVSDRNPAVLALLNSAGQQRQRKQYVAAAASLERAIRIAPRDAELYLELAKIRFQQNNREQAEQLCRKAIALSDDGGYVKYHCRQLLGG